MVDQEEVAHANHVSLSQHLLAHGSGVHLDASGSRDVHDHRLALAPLEATVEGSHARVGQHEAVLAVPSHGEHG